MIFIQISVWFCGSTMFVLKTGFKYFCKGNTWNSKTGESVIFHHIRAETG